MPNARYAGPRRDMSKALGLIRVIAITIATKCQIACPGIDHFMFILLMRVPTRYNHNIKNAKGLQGEKLDFTVAHADTIKSEC